MDKIFKLPISPNYVKHWGLWEAVRELYQNALDAKDQLGCKASIHYEPPAVREDGQGVIVIDSSDGSLTPRSLVLGNSTKDGTNTRGKFGEGYKLALLVLKRLGHHICVMTSPGDVWAIELSHDEDFDSEILSVEVLEGTIGPWEGVRFRIHGVDEDQWAEIQRNICPYFGTSITLKEPEQAGRIYQGGLFVCHQAEFKYGYCFRPEDLPLDRDRGMVNDFDLKCLVADLWKDSDDDAVADLIEAESPEVEFLAARTYSHTPAATTVYRRYVEKHGEDTVPCADQNEIQRAQDAGLKWALVPRVMRKMLDFTKRWIVPSTKSPAERLRDFIDQNKYQLNQSQREELQSILASISPAKEN